MSYLKLSRVEEVIKQDYSYSVIVDYLRLVKRYGTKIKISPPDPELLNVLRCNSQAGVSTKLKTLYDVGLLDRQLLQEKKSGRTAFSYTMN